MIGIYIMGKTIFKMLALNYIGYMDYPENEGFYIQFQGLFLSNCFSGRLMVSLIKISA